MRHSFQLHDTEALGNRRQRENIDAVHELADTVPGQCAHVLHVRLEPLQVSACEVPVFRTSADERDGSGFVRLSDCFAKKVDAFSYRECAEEADSEFTAPVVVREGGGGFAV